MLAWYIQVRIKLRRLFGVMAIIKDLSERLLAVEVDVQGLECDKVGESDKWALENDIQDIQERLDKLEE